ncbi:CHP02587-containing protein [Crocosphaera subtropica ATCC 51142]|uniref:CHP02587-containing protein n=1 Tax=Crocosphaera subtropica (strain ATCC 51142 / BH68) TaxID=43989 RepID=B1WY78_CROS5|nr:CHP02587-containing protein [Crocosphaera subtropica ATCC 51142]
MFGIPLVYTMEVWHIGSQIDSSLMLLILFITYLLVFSLNSIEGFRRKKRKGWTDAFLESNEALAIGCCCATFTLLLLQKITLITPLEEVLGKIVFEAVPFAIGTALSRILLDGKPKKSSNESGNPQGNEQSINVNETLADVSASFMGAMIVAFSIAPTDEVRVLAVSASPPWLILITMASLLISYMIVFAAGFTNQAKRKKQRGLFQTPEAETVISYLIALFTSGLMLLFFQQLNFNMTWFLWLQYTIILGLPAAIGGAAGRIAI